MRSFRTHKLTLIVVMFVCAVLHGARALAQDIDKESPSVQTAEVLVPTLPTWKLNYSQYFYSFQGDRASVSNDYDFDKITSRMQFLNVNYALPKNWSVNVLVQHYDNYIETIFPKFQNTAFARSDDRITGISDTYITVIAPVSLGYPWVVTADFGVSLPTGDIGYKAHLPGLENINLAYNAQLGSGTVDGLLGGTLLYLQPNYMIGGRAFANIRTGQNKYEYRLGNQYRIDGWFDYNFKNGITPRLVGYYRYKDQIVGVDETRGRLEADNYFYSKQMNWDISAALKYQKNFYKSKLAFVAEAGIPIAQENINVDNSFVRTLYYVNAGLNAAF